MNRKHRRSLILLPLSLGVVGLFVGREMASWRPVEVARFSLSARSELGELTTSNYAVEQKVYPSPTSVERDSWIFDTRNQTTHKVVSFSDNAVDVQDDFSWKQTGDPFSIEVVDGKNQKKKFSRSPPIESVNRQCLRILPDQNRLIALDYYIIVEWNFQKQTLKRAVRIPPSADGNGARGIALSRDARQFILVNQFTFRIGDTTTGKITHTSPMGKGVFYEDVSLSPYGRYALCEQSAGTPVWRVVETRTGKWLWRFTSHPGSSLWAISDDQNTIVIPADKNWEVRDLQSGAVQRQLPFVPGATVAALSPDGKALYSVAKGVLYRQRAR